MNDEHSTGRGLDRLFNELTVAVTIAGAAMLTTGFLLVWARAVSEGLPTQVILASMPKWFYVQVAITSMFASLAFTFIVGGIWVTWAVWRLRVSTPPKNVGPWMWFAFGALIGVLSWCAAQFLTGAAPDGRPWQIWALLPVAALLAGAGAYAGAKLGANRLNPGPDTKYWKRARPVLALTIALCFVTSGAVRVIDATFTRRALPFTQVLVDRPCERVTSGRIALPPNGTKGLSSSALQALELSRVGRCLVGGYNIGLDDKWVFLAQRDNSDPTRCDRARLVAIPREQVQAIVLMEESPASVKDVVCK